MVAASSGLRHTGHTYAAVDLIEQSRTESTDDGKEQHGRRDTCRLYIETLRLALEGTEAHGQTWQEENTGKDTADDTSLNELGLALFEGHTVEEDLNNSGEEGVDGRTNTHGRLSGDGGDSLADEVRQRNDRQQGKRKDQEGIRDPDLVAERLCQDEVVEDGEGHQPKQIDQEDVGAVDGVLPVLDTNCARVATQVVEQKQRDLTHWNGEDHEPTESRDQEERWSDDAVEVDVEDDTTESPFSTPEEAVLRPRSIRMGDVGAAITAEQACGLAAGRVDTVASAAYQRREASIRTEEESTLLDVAALPLLVFADAAALALILFGKM
ncbi:hypothetical protein OPT61_g10299 [Boeremia exigua]|uniref:Uncharacterized protein n=1 Tax=Boeremia exigua TaxID=749465 RepID=A0ACC2HRS0_9PLEO|nr:hypothetical protein OPT61_g10299 [Boeremia exigua]